MLKFINYNKKNSLNNLEIILNKRKFSQKNKTSVVKKIILDVKKNGDSAVLKYEKKFSKIKTKSKKNCLFKKRNKWNIKKNRQKN